MTFVVSSKVALAAVSPAMTLMGPFVPPPVVVRKPYSPMSRHFPSSCGSMDGSTRVLPARPRIMATKPQMSAGPMLNRRSGLPFLSNFDSYSNALFICHLIGPSATPSCSLKVQICPSLSEWHTTLKKRSMRSEEHTSELQSLRHLVCRLLL